MDDTMDDVLVRSGVVVERYAETKANFTGLYELLVNLHATVGVAPLNPLKLAQQAFTVASLGMTFLARDQATGAVVGSLSLVETGFWYSDETFLNDKWFYVRPEFRGSGSRAGVRLLHAARDEGQARNKMVFVFNTNPDKRQKHEVGDVVQRLGFVPHGYMMRLR